MENRCRSLEELFYDGERVVIMIDGPNFYQTVRGLGFEVDYRRLLDAFSGSSQLIRAMYYTALVDDQEYSPIRPLVDWLDYNGYSVTTKTLKEFTDASGRRKFKGNMDIELAVDAMELARSIDHIVLFSGDGDFCCLVGALQRKALRVTVCSTIKTQPPMIADELRRAANVFLDVEELQPFIGREGGGRVAAIAPLGNDAGNDLRVAG